MSKNNSKTHKKKYDAFIKLESMTLPLNALNS